MRTIRDIFGPPSHQPFGFYDPGSSSVRTSQATLLSDSTPSSLTLPRWGCLSGGALYELPTPALLTSGNGSSGLLLPTAHAQEPGFVATRARTKDGKVPTHGNQRWYDAETGRLMQKGLHQVVAVTQGAGATANLPKDSAGTIDQPRDSGNPIPPPAMPLLPTPAVNDMGAGKTPKQWDSWTGEMRERHGNGNGHGRSLSIEAQRLLPTPTTQDAKQNALNATEAERNPHTMWAAMRRISHGDPTSLRSDGGSSSTEPPPGQLTIEAA